MNCLCLLTLAGRDYPRELVRQPISQDVQRETLIKLLERLLASPHHNKQFPQILQPSESSEKIYSSQKLHNSVSSGNPVRQRMEEIISWPNIISLSTGNTEKSAEWLSAAAVGVKASRRLQHQQFSHQLVGYA